MRTFECITVGRFRRLRIAAIVVACGLLGVGLTTRPEAADDEAETAQPGEVDRTYFAPEGLSAADLLDWLERMQNKPATIRARPGFVAALLDATARLTADAQATGAVQNAALLYRFEVLHFAALQGDAQAEEQLYALAATTREHAHAPVAQAARWALLEQRCQSADKLEPAEREALLQECRDFLAAAALDEPHLRLASRSVKVVNMLDEDADRVRWFKELGELLAKAKVRKVAGYGKQLVKASQAKQLVGQPLELEGKLLDGSDLQWDTYRGKVVLVMFWATWCGPCRAEMPNVVQAHNDFHERGFEVVGISLDNDREAVETYLKENPLPWATLFDDAGDHPLAEKYGVRAIPAEFLVDKDGKVIAEGVRGPALAQKLEKLLPKP